MPGRTKPPRELRRERLPGIVVLKLLVPMVGYPKLAGIGVIMLVGAIVPNILVLSLGWLVSEVTSGTSDADLIPPLTVIGLSFLTSSIYPWILESIGATLGRRFDTELRDEAMAAASSVTGIAHLEDPANADRLTAVEDLLHGWLTHRSVQGLIDAWTARMRATISAVILGGFAWWAPLLIFIAYRAVRAYSMKTGFLYLRRHITNTQTLRRAAYIRELMHRGTAAKESRIFGISDWFIDRFRMLWREGMRSTWNDRGRAPMIGIPVGLFAAAVLGFVFYRIGLSGTGELTVATAVVYLQAIGGMAGFQSSGDAEWQMHFGAYRATDATRMREAVRTSASDLRGDILPEPLSSSLRFDDVHFSYPGQDREVLSGVSFEVPAGSSLAIVGENGVGKTTSIKLLARLYDPTSGSILIDGVDLRSIDPEAWRKQVGVIFQDFIRYELSARENIGLAAPELMHDEAALRRAASLAGADTFLDKVGWDAPLSRRYEGGIDISGGEWQRVALARALFAVQAGARLLILDEPTANLDVRAEAAIYERFLQMTEGITTILISHRFSTVRMADRIVVIEHGKVIEFGSHDELMARNGRYAEMFLSQASAYQDQEEVPSFDA